MIHALKSHWRLVAIASLLSLSLLIFHGMSGTPEGKSYQYNLPWIDAFHTAFWQGDLYPRFAPDLWYGMGALDFYFYAPMPFWIGSTLGAATCPGCDTATMFALTGAWITIASGLTFFLFARRFFKVPWAGFGAIIYAILPYHYVAEWYDRQAVGELTGYIFIPLIALAMIKLLEDRKGGVLFALSVAGLTFSHLPSTLIVGHFVAAILLWSVAKQETWPARFETLARFAVWGGLGIALSAIYWMPALGLLNTVSPDMLATDYYVATDWLLLDGRPEVNPETSLFVKACLTLVVAVTLVAALVLKQSQTSSSLWRWIVGPSLFTFFFMTVFSYPIWEFWILNKVQFPWRTLIIGDVSLALGSIVIARYLVQNWSGAERSRAQIFAAFTLSFFMVTYLVQMPLAFDNIRASAERAGSFEPVGTPEYVPPRTLELALERFRSEVNDTHSDQDRFYLFFDQMRQSAERARATFQTDEPGGSLTAHPHNRLTLQVDLAEAAEIRLPLAAWPYWRAQTSDGRIVNLGTDADLGLATITLPAGPSDVDVFIATTAPERLGSGLSTLALILLLGGAAFRQLSIKSRSAKPLATSLS